MTPGADPRRPSLPEEAAELVEAVKAWSSDPEVRARLATAATSLLEAGAALLDTVAERQHARQGRSASESPTSEPPPDEASAGKAPDPGEG